jgi:hypothetical protein
MKRKRQPYQPVQTADAAMCMKITHVAQSADIEMGNSSSFVVADTTIATFTSTGGNNTGGNNGTDNNINLSFLINGFSFTSGHTLQLRRDTAGDLVLVFVSVPEPSLLFGGAVAILGVVGMGRRYFAKQASKPLAA